MKIIGITGPSGAGKSYFSDFLREHGIPVIDADELYHSLLVPPSDCLCALRAAFGDSVFFDSGELNRQALSKIVFGDNEKLLLLNSTVLGFVLDRAREIFKGLEKEGHTAVAFDAPTLIESGFNKECSCVVSVICPPDIRKNRIMARDGISESAALSRINAQKPDSFYIEHSDHVLVNDSSIEEFAKKCASLVKSLDI